MQLGDVLQGLHNTPDTLCFSIPGEAKLAPAAKGQGSAAVLLGQK